ncbi:MAG: hypothetical protein AB7G48_07300 [Nitrospiraceae bacterium]
MRLAIAFMAGSMLFLCVVVPVTADEPGMVDASHYYGMTGVVSKIHSGMLFVQPPVGLQARAISPRRVDRVGLHNAKIGDRVNLWVDSGNVLIDARADGLPAPDHRVIAGRLTYSDAFWSEITISTPDGTEIFEVDSLAGSKFSTFAEGMPVEVELDADNVVIDVSRSP